MSEPRISVVVPVFNAGPFLEVMLSSLQNQSISDFEIVAVDDGSTDGSLSVLQEAARKDKRIVVVSQKNGGASAARNTGMTHARGRWVMFADSDDWLDPKLLESWAGKAEDSRLDLHIGNYFRFREKPDESGGNVRAELQRQPWEEIVSGEEWIIRRAASAEWPNGVWVQLISRDLIQQSKIRFAVGNVGHEDVLWTLHLALAARRVGFSSAPLYGYRINIKPTTKALFEIRYENRARSHLMAMSQLAATADEKRGNQRLRRALLRETGYIGGFLYRLMKKKRDVAVRAELARSYFNLGLSAAMFRGAANVHELMRALRCWARFRVYMAVMALKGNR